METHLFWDQKVKGQGHESQKQCWYESLYSYEWWLFLVFIVYGVERDTDTVITYVRPYVCLSVCSSRAGIRFVL